MNTYIQTKSRLQGKIDTLTKRIGELNVEKFRLINLSLTAPEEIVTKHFRITIKDGNWKCKNILPENIIDAIDEKYLNGKIEVEIIFDEKEYILKSHIYELSDNMEYKSSYNIPLITGPKIF